jgi:NADH:ubiquinone oxidoreductase subunit F (NADH-binding)
VSDFEPILGRSSDLGGGLPERKSSERGTGRSGPQERGAPRVDAYGDGSDELPGAPDSYAHRSSAPGLPRLLAGIPARGALNLSEHLALHGELPMPDGRGRRGSSALIDVLERAGLRGRGGAGFPTAAKLRAVAAGGGRSGHGPTVRKTGSPRTGTGRLSPLGGRPIVVVNAAEGEPASFKDRTLLQSLPHLVLDGALLAAVAIGAREILLGICESAAEALDAAARAIAERRQPRGREPTIKLIAVPNRYVAGQESALVNYLGGGPALPTFTPPRPFERGVRGHPTLVCNVETLAHLALIARHGAEWFRELGTPEQPGSALVTLSGPLAHPGVYEIEHGSPLPALLGAAGGATARLRAVLLGGYSGTWIDAGQAGSEFRGVTLSDRHLAPYGATLGAGVVAALSTDACPVAELARLTRWLAAQSARQCGPCVFGLDALATTFEQLVLGGSQPGRVAIPRLQSLAGLVDGRGACSHPDGAARLVASALEVFAEELADHAHHGPCVACGRPSELPRPRASVAGHRAPSGRRAPSPAASRVEAPTTVG